MAKDPKKLNPGNPYSKTYPGQDLNTGVAPKSTSLLPAIFRTETNKKVLGAIFDDLFQPSSIETLNYTVGRNQPKDTGMDYLPHPIARRQLETGLVLFNDEGASVLTADDVATAWNLNDRTTETVEPEEEPNPAVWNSIVSDLSKEPEPQEEYGESKFVYKKR